MYHHVLHFIVLNYTALYRTILYCTTLHWTTLYYTVIYYHNHHRYYLYTNTSWAINLTQFFYSSIKMLHKILISNIYELSFRAVLPEGCVLVYLFLAFLARLYCTVLYLYNTVLYYAVFYNTVLLYTVQCSIVLHCMVWYCVYAL